MANSAGISFSGLSSGIDTDSLIRQLAALERQPITRLQTQQALLNTRKAVYEQFKGLLVQLNTAASAFNNPGAFDAMSATSSNSDIASISSTANANVGIRELMVTRLATAHRVSSAAQGNSNQALGMSGQFKVGEATINVSASDTLQAIAGKINAAGVDAQANIVDGGAGHAYLTLASKQTGAAHQLQLEDLNVAGPLSARDGVLARLGLVQLNAYSGDLPSLTSEVLSSTDIPLSEVLGLPGGEQTLTINGQSLTVDFSQDTAETFAGKLDSLRGVQAQIVSGRLEIVSDTPISLDIPGLGFTSGTANVSLAGANVTQLTAGQDAEYVLDGISLTSASNTLEGVIPGVTITLKKADPATVSLTIERDTESVMGTVKGLMTAYNRINAFIRDNSAFNADTYDSGILFGDSVTSQVSSLLNSTLFNSVSGLATNLQNLTQIGFSLADNGDLEVDDAALQSAIETNSNAVANLLRSSGTGSNELIKFIGGSNKAKEGTYSIVVTQLATQSTNSASVAQTEASVAEEVLSFSGATFGTNGVALVVPAGSSQADIVNLINADSRLKDSVSASVADGKLSITSKRYGAASNFTVSSSAAAAANTSGIGSEAVHVTGLDIAGTINGEAATGSGRFLLGNTGNANTEGLQIEYSGLVTGDVGSLTYTRGMGAMLFSALDTFINYQDGLFTNTSKSLDSQISDLDDQIERISARADKRTEELRLRFAAMEAAMSRSQSQLAQLQQALASMGR